MSSKLRWNDKKNELKRIDDDIKNAYTTVQFEEDPEVKGFGLRKLNQHASKLSPMKEGVEFGKYFNPRKLHKPRFPSTEDVHELDTALKSTMEQVQTKSQEAESKRAAAEASRRAAEAKPRHIIPPEELRRRSIQNHVPVVNPPIAQGAPSPAASAISLSSARFQRAQTPAVVLTGLTPPPRHPYHAQTGASTSSSPNYDFEARNATASTHYRTHGHQRNDTMSTQWSGQSVVQEEGEGSMEE